MHFSHGLEAIKDVSSEVDFLLWTRENPEIPDKLIIGNITALSISHYNPQTSTKILIHGFGDTGTTGWVKNVRNKYFEKGDKGCVIL